VQVSPSFEPTERDRARPALAARCGTNVARTLLSRRDGSPVSGWLSAPPTEPGSPRCREPGSDAILALGLRGLQLGRYKPPHAARQNESQSPNFCDRQLAYKVAAEDLDIADLEPARRSTSQAAERPPTATVRCRAHSESSVRSERSKLHSIFRPLPMSSEL
jgi:hypothetical protein